jgi:peptidoglycan-associated lipoprotein
MKNHGKAVFAFAMIASLGGCATTGTVDQKIADAQAESNRKIESVAGQVEDLQEKQKQTDARLDQLSQEAREALRRAQEAGVLARGQVAFEQSFSEDRVKFKVDSYELNGQSRAALDEFAGRVKALGEPVFIEIQGHTDDTGGTRYNDELGQRRADAVRRYLSRQHGLPLNRMSTISYGDTLPTQPNRTRQGRSANRRVVMVVLV